MGGVIGQKRPSRTEQGGEGEGGGGLVFLPLERSCGSCGRVFDVMADTDAMFKARYPRSCPGCGAVFKGFALSVKRIERESSAFLGVFRLNGEKEEEKTAAEPTIMVMERPAGWSKRALEVIKA